MDRRQTLITAALCELVGLAMMIFLNRLVPTPINVIVTIVGFLLLLAGPFFIVFRRDS